MLESDEEEDGVVAEDVNIDVGEDEDEDPLVGDVEVEIPVVGPKVELEDMEVIVVGLVAVSD